MTTVEELAVARKTREGILVSLRLSFASAQRAC